MKYPGTLEADFESFSQFLSPPLRLPSMGLKVNKQAPIIKMQVPVLDGKGLVPGYRTLNVLGITPERRGILYHRLAGKSRGSHVFLFKNDRRK
jgi:hypothetical protein